MKSIYFSSSITAAVLATALSCGTRLHAVTTSSVQPVSGINGNQNQFESVDDIVVFSKRPEAKMLTHAYAILANGDHDYKGHRVQAMRHVEAAGKFLGVDLAGDLKGHKKQVLSDDQLRQARRLLNKLIDTAIIKNQPRVVDQLNAATSEIDLALATK